MLSLSLSLNVVEAYHLLESSISRVEQSCFRLYFSFLFWFLTAELRSTLSSGITATILRQMNSLSLLRMSWYLRSFLPRYLMMIYLSQVHELLVQVARRVLLYRFFWLYSIYCSLYRRSSDSLSCTQRLKSSLRTLMRLRGYLGSELGCPPSDLYRLRWERVGISWERRVSSICFCEQIANFEESRFLLFSSIATCLRFLSSSGLMSLSTMPIMASLSTLRIYAESDVQIAVYSKGLSSMISYMPHTSDLPSTQKGLLLPSLVILSVSSPSRMTNS